MTWVPPPYNFVTCAGVSNAAAPPGGDGSGGPGSGPGVPVGTLDQTEPPELPERCGVSVLDNV